jgi:tRNA A-37 threonylcarbamoyl transferase component Bud32
MEAFINSLIYPKIESIHNDGSGRNKWEQYKYPVSSRGGPIATATSVVCDVICTDDTLYFKDQIYILKFIPFKAYSEHLEEARNMINNEIDLQKASSTIGVSLPVIDSWFSDLGGIIIMEKLEIDADTFLEDCKLLEVKHFHAEITTLIGKLHEIGIYHGDLHVGNIMGKSNDHDIESDGAELMLFAGKRYRWYLIDFGEGGYLKDSSFNLIKADYDKFEENYEYCNTP